MKLGPDGISSELMSRLWPHLCRAIGMDPAPGMPPVEHVQAMWPFVSGSLALAGNHSELVFERMVKWPQQLWDELPTTSSARKGRNFLDDLVRAERAKAWRLKGTGRLGIL